MVKYEDELRRSEWGSSVYKACGMEDGYLEATAKIQNEVCIPFLARKEIESLERGMELLLKAPHILGREDGSSLACYIKGSYAIHPLERLTPLQPDQHIPATVEVIPLHSESRVPLASILSKSPFTIVFAGSAT